MCWDAMDVRGQFITPFTTAASGGEGAGRATSKLPTADHPDAVHNFPILEVDVCPRMCVCACIQAMCVHSSIPCVTHDVCFRMCVHECMGPGCVDRLVLVCLFPFVFTLPAPPRHSQLGHTAGPLA